MPIDQHDSEASFVPASSVRKLRQHLPAKRFRSSDGFVAGPGKRVRSREPPRFEQEENRGNRDWNKEFFSVFSVCSRSIRSGDNKLAASSKSSEQRRHGFAICRCREDQSGAAEGLKRGNRLLNLGVNV